MENALDTRLVQTFRCFQELTPEQTTALAQCLRRANLPKGHTIFREGDAGETAYFIVSGEIEVSASSPTEEDCSLATIGAGQILGEISLLTGCPRTATAVTLGAVEAWEMSRETLETAADRGEPWANRFLLSVSQTLANRLATVSQQIVSLIADRNRPAEKKVAELDRLRERLLSEWSF